MRPRHWPESRRAPEAKGSSPSLPLPRLDSEDNRAEGALDIQLQVLLQTPAMKQAGQAAPASQPILEVNPSHALVKKLESDEAHFADLAHLLFDQAVLAEGGALENPAEHVQRVTRLLVA